MILSCHEWSDYIDDPVKKNALLSMKTYDTYYTKMPSPKLTPRGVFSSLLRNNDGFEETQIDDPFFWIKEWNVLVEKRGKTDE